MNKLEQAVINAINVANDNKIGYSQAANQRWTVSRDCSSLVIKAFEDAGIKVKSAGATYTGNMLKAFEKCGFKAIKYNSNIKLFRGDVLLNEAHHTAIMISSNQLVHASIDENGHITGGKIGDQTGKEICIRSFYNPSYKWQYVLRYDPDNNMNNDDLFLQAIPVLRKGSKGDLVKYLQAYISIKSNHQLDVDGSFGADTLSAVKEWQFNHHLTVDGVVGPYTWASIVGC